MRIRAAVLREPGHPVAVEEVELDPPKADEVLVRIAAVGVCHSDVRLADGDLGPGRWPAVLGHEGAGVVESVGDGITHVRPGDHVALCFVPACRVMPRTASQESRISASSSPKRARAARCSTARAGFICLTGRRCSTGFALPASPTSRSSHQAAPFQSRAELPLWQAALLGCGVVTGMGAVRNAAQVQPGDAAAVIGCGGVGLQVVAGLRLAGADPIVALDRVPEKLELALAQGATHTIATSAEPDPVAALHQLTDGGVDFAFEVVGRPETIRLAWDLTRPGGTAVVVGLAPDGVEASVPAIEFLNDKSLRGTYYGSGDPAAELPRLAAMALAGELDLAGVVTSVGPLEGVNDALDRLRHGEGARTVLIIDPTLAGYEATA